MDNGISTVNLTKSYGSLKAVDSLSIEVKPGEIFGFLGPNGAGKTTTIKMLCSLLLPSSGTATLAGYDVVREGSKVKSVIGLLPEGLGFYNWMNAIEYLTYFASLYAIQKKEAMKRTNDLLRKVGLADKSHAPIEYYSRGMKQRLGLARALINEPRIILLDEPTLGLDPHGQQDMQRTLRELNRAGATIFLSSHALSEVSNLCDRVAIINHGKLVAEGTVEELRKLAGDHKSLLVRIPKLDNSHELRLPFKFQVKNNENFTDVIINGDEPVADVVNMLKSKGLDVYEVLRPEMSLEDIFFRLTMSKKGMDGDA